MTNKYDYDFFVIGGGSGGVRAARMAGGFGARVGVAEERYWGGTCVNVGCVPKKLFSYAAHYGHDFEDAVAYGWSKTEPEFDWQVLVENKNREIARLNGIYTTLLTNAGCEIFAARATLVDDHTIDVAGKQVTAENILIATGGWPYIPEGPGDDLVKTSNDAFHFERFPKRLLVIGGGYIATELASIFSGMGSHVTQVHRGDRVLRGFDEELRTFITEELAKTIVELRLEHLVDKVEEVPGGLRASLSDGSTLEVDEILCCVGRRPLTKGLGLETAGVDIAVGGGVLVDDSYRTNVPHIYAVGDVTDRVQLTPVALAEGMAVAYSLYGPHERPMSYDNIATAVFCNPNVGTVGLTEEAARAAHKNVDVYVSKFRPMKHTLSGRDSRSMMKLVVDADTDRVLGVHVVGDDAGEIVQGLAVAMNCGATKAQFDMTIGVHPTAAEELVTMRTKRETPE